jgi:YebC/PmpR family DNA-binding regulatory protein
MAGHSKWANIKHKKDRSDQKKGKVFSRCAKEIISAVKDGGPDIKGNSRLRLAVQKAKAANVPNDVIDRNIKKAASADQAAYHDLTYELYGHGGVGLIVEIMTDNKNRIASEMRIATKKSGGTVAASGSVAFNFEQKGVIRVPENQAIEDELFTLTAEAGAEDFEHVEDHFEITTAPADFLTVKEVIDGKGMVTTEAELRMIPKLEVEVDIDTARSNLALIEFIEDLEDVDAVHHNMSLSDELQTALASEE